MKEGTARAQTYLTVYDNLLPGIFASAYAHTETYNEINRLAP